MVISVPNKGMSVRHVSLEELDEIFDMRLMMDLYFMKDILSTFSYNKILQEQMRKNIEEHSALVQNKMEILHIKAVHIIVLTMLFTNYI